MIDVDILSELVVEGAPRTIIRILALPKGSTVKEQACCS